MPWWSQNQSSHKISSSTIQKLISFLDLNFYLTLDWRRYKSQHFDVCWWGATAYYRSLSILTLLINSSDKNNMCIHATVIVQISYFHHHPNTFSNIPEFSSIKSQFLIEINFYFISLLKTKYISSKNLYVIYFKDLLLRSS